MATALDKIPTGEHNKINPTDEPADNNPTDEPADNNPTDEPADNNPTDEPADNNPTDEPADNNPTDILSEAANYASSGRWPVVFTNAFGNEKANYAGHICLTKKRDKIRVIFQNKIPVKCDSQQLRWISKEAGICDMITVSYDLKDSVEYQFFTVPSGKSEFVFDSLAALLKMKIPFPLNKMDVFSALTQQPVYVDVMKVSIQDISKDTSAVAMPSSYTEYMVIVDLECLSLFTTSSQKPKHQLLFWTEPGPNSIEQVKLTSKIYVTINTVSSSFEFIADPEFIDVVRDLKPQKCHVFTDFQSMLCAFKPGHTIGTVYQKEEVIMSRRWKGDKDGCYDDNQHEDRFQRRRNEGRMTQASGALWYKHFDQNDCNETPAGKLRDELVSAVQFVNDNEDLQNMWICIEHDIEDTITSGFIPKTDAGSGGLDPNNIDHLRKSLQDIQDHLVEDNIPVAISRLRVFRELFNEDTSTIPGLHLILQYDDLYLLKALYMRSLG